MNLSDALDRIPTIRADAALTLICLALQDEIRIAVRPDALAPVYRPATRQAVALARQAFRQVVALVGREDLRKLMVQAAAYHSGPTEPSTVMGRSWTGD